MEESCGKGKGLGAAGRRIQRLTGKAWCGPREGQNTQLGCGSVAASGLHLPPALLQHGAAQRDFLGGCAPHPKAGPAAIPAAGSSNGSMAWARIPRVFNSRRAGWRQEASGQAPAGLA